MSSASSSSTWDMARWYKQLAPAGETSIVFRDSTFVVGRVKTNLTASLQQRGRKNMRSL